MRCKTCNNGLTKEEEEQELCDDCYLENNDCHCKTCTCNDFKELTINLSRETIERLRKYKEQYPKFKASRLIESLIIENWQDLLPFDEKDYPELPTCNKCKGKGYINDHICYHCAGIGRNRRL